MTINLNPIGTYSTDIFLKSAAEIPAYDPLTQRLFVANAQSASVDVIDLSDPTNPVKIGEIVGADFGGLVNSVTVKNGIVAVAVEANVKTDPGRAILFRTNADFSTVVQPEGNFPVGALPDAITFTPDGRKIFVANEGEPNDDYTIDPEGSVTIIDISNGIGNATVVTANFNAFDDRKDELIAQGVRIFGPNATVSQDLEPEWITFSADSKTAYVSLQENNAIAIIDVDTNTVTDIKPLGFVDHNASPNLTTVFFDDAQLPVIGNSATLGDVLLGGFSGLYFEGVNPDNGNLKFITHPDIGPSATGNRDLNGDGTPERVRTYFLPDLQPSVVRFEYNSNNGDIQLVEQIFLSRQDGTPLTGLPNLPSDDTGRIPIDENGNILDFDPLGADLEGIVVAPNGTFWMADEYRPAIYHFQPDGTLINRFVPQGLPPEVGTGVFPEEYNTRQANRGFEAIALQDGKFYAFMQSPFNNPDSGETSTVRILEFDPATSTVVGEYLYLQEDIGGGSDKIGDAVATNKIGEFLVIERDSSISDDSQKVVFRINLNRATNLQTLPDGILEAGETFDNLTVAQLAQKGINPVTKEVFADLNGLGYDFTDKPEGLAWINETTVAVINDNDFAEAGIPIGLGIITLNNAFDASDRDNAINIRNWPVFGIRQPDTIASYEVNGQTFIVTANEGDARDYDGFSEELRASRLLLDPVAFPNASELQRNDQLGRLTVTNTLGMSDRAIFVSELEGSQEVPPATTNAMGQAFAWVDDNGFLQVELQVTGLDFGALTGNPMTETTADDVTALHIHEAFRGVNGGVVWDVLADADTVITINEDGTTNLTSIWQENIIEKTAQGEDSEYYFNLHTTGNPGGEIRGQIIGEVAYDRIFSYGSRSFSIFNSDIELVFDSGSQFEQIIAQQIADGILPFEAFNANHNNNDSFDTRSDNKGPEPEGIAIGEINGIPYAFIGLERIGGVMVYNISNPEAPEFIQYINNRNFKDENGNFIPTSLGDGISNPAAGDLGAEGVIFISAEDSPNGVPLVVVANEVSGTTTIFEVEVPRSNFTLQLLHASDQEAGIPALQDAIGFSAVMNALDARYENTLKLTSGDLFIAGPFFNASLDIYGQQGIADILIQNALGWDAAAVGNHEFDAGPATFFNMLAPNPNRQGVGIAPETGYLGALFPYLATNLDYSTDSSNLKNLVVDSGEAPLPNSLTESVVIDVNGEQVGVIGAVVPYLPAIANIGGITMLTNPTSRDIEVNAQFLADNIQPFVDELVSQGINKIILMTHLQQFEIEQALATKLTDVDIIMGGGSHRVMANDDDILRQDETQTPPELLQPYPQVFEDADGNDVYLINTGANYRYLGQLILEFDPNGRIIEIGDDSGTFATDIAGVDRLYEESITTFDQVKELANPDLVEIVDNVGEFINSSDGNIFGNTEVYLNGLRGSVRTEETNLGNLTADANLWYAQQYGLEVDISVKNGGGIRDQIGVSFIDGGTNELIQLPPQPNPAVGKEEGDISELDIANSLRFDNTLSVADISAQGIKDLAEHFVAQWAQGATPGQFGQIGGFSFSFDPDNTPIAFTRDDDGVATGVNTPGERIQNLVLNREDGTTEAIVLDGELVVDADTTYKMVILDFLAAGGDSYPAFYFENVVRLDSLNPDNLPNNSDLPIGGEQDALAEYLAEFHPSADEAFNQPDTPIEEDTRIQNLNFRDDSLLDNPVTINIGNNGGTFDFGDRTNDLVIVGGDGDDNIMTGSGNDRIVLGDGDNIVNAGAGNDVIVRSVLLGFTNQIDGGEGLDTVIYNGAFADFPISVENGVVTVGTNNDTLTNIQQLQFNDRTVLVEDLVVDPILDEQIYRFRTGNGTYLYVGEEERQRVLQGNFGFTDEGEAFKVSLEADDDLNPIYRFRNTNLRGSYLFVGETERQSLLTDNNFGFIEEGLAFHTYGANAQQGDDIYRFQTQPGGYIFVGETERQSIQQNFSSFTQEGIAFEALA